MATLQVPSGIRSLADRWLFRVGRPDAAPTVLGRRRIFVLPTPAGLAFAMALLVMLVAAINYNLSLGYGLVFLLGGVGVVSIIHAFRNLLNLSVSPGRVEPVFAGDRAVFHLLVGNDRDHARVALRLRAGGASTPFEAAANDTTEVAITRPTVRRGWLPVGRITIETIYPLGLIRAWSVIVPDMSCLVYPAPEPAPPPLPDGSIGERGAQSGRPGDDDFAGLRSHQPADSPRHVAWKAVAAGGPMLTKQFSGLEGGTIDLDWLTLPDQLDAEARIARLTAWVIAAEARGIAYALRTPGIRIPAASGPAHARACLTRLALVGNDRDPAR